MACLLLVPCLWQLGSLLHPGTRKVPGKRQMPDGQVSEEPWKTLPERECPGAKALAGAAHAVGTDDKRRRWRAMTSAQMPSPHRQVARRHACMQREQRGAGWTPDTQPCPGRRDGWTAVCDGSCGRPLWCSSAPVVRDQTRGLARTAGRPVDQAHMLGLHSLAVCHVGADFWGQT